jgi:hypothetical protein
LLFILIAELNDPVVNVPLLAVVAPIGPGLANVFPFNKLAFKFATFVVLLTIKGAVPVDTVLVSVEPETFPVAVSDVAEATPKVGVTNVGDVFKTTEPLPVLVDVPVPPFTTGKAEPE